MIIEAGSTGDEMYFISSGICEVSINGDIKATLYAGSFFGGNVMKFLMGRNISAFWEIKENSLYKKRYAMYLVFFIEKAIG